MELDLLMGRETATSAFLATLLRDDEAFRRDFFNLIEAHPPFDASEQWTVRVEDTRALVGSMDVTLESDSTFVLIENKIAASAKQDGQLLAYYQGAVKTWGNKRVVALYLAPNRITGASEVDQVENSREFLERQARPATPASPDQTAAIAWIEDIGPTISALPEGGGWFTTTGMKAIRKALDDNIRGLPPDDQRDEVRSIAEEARRALAAHFADIRFGRWPSDDNEWIHTVGAPVTVSVTALYQVGPEPSFTPINVVGVDGRIRLTAVATGFGLSTRGLKLPAVVGEWEQREAAGPMTIAGLDFTLRNRTFVHEQRDWTGDRDALKDLIAERFRLILEELPRRLTMPVTTE